MDHLRKLRLPSRASNRPGRYRRCRGRTISPTTSSEDGRYSDSDAASRETVDGSRAFEAIREKAERQKGAQLRTSVLERIFSRIRRCCPSTKEERIDEKLSNVGIYRNKNRTLIYLSYPSSSSIYKFSSFFLSYLKRYLC